MNRIIQREIEVAFSKHSQPVWFRSIKWVFILTGIFFFHDNAYFFPSAVLLTALAILLHLLWRYKTKGWTQSWYGWDYEKNKPKELIQQ